MTAVLSIFAPNRRSSVRFHPLPTLRGRGRANIAHVTDHSSRMIWFFRLRALWYLDRSIFVSVIDKNVRLSVHDPLLSDHQLLMNDGMCCVSLANEDILTKSKEIIGRKRTKFKEIIWRFWTKSKDKIRFTSPLFLHKHGFCAAVEYPFVELLHLLTKNIDRIFFFYQLFAVCTHL